MANLENHSFRAERCYFNGLRTPSNKAIEDFLSDLKEVFDKYGIKSIRYGDIGYIPPDLGEFILYEAEVRGENAK